MGSSAKTRREGHGRGGRGADKRSPEGRGSHGPPRGDWRAPGAWLAGGLLLLLAILVYLPAARGPFTWDDNDYVWDNPTLRSAEGLADIWLRPSASPQYYPLVFSTFWIEHHLWGDNPSGYRMVNVLLHGLSAILLWRLLRRLDVPGAFLAAAVFAVHPVMVESVAWITERKNTLSLALYLAAMIGALRFLGIGQAADGPAAPRTGMETANPGTAPRAPSPELPAWPALIGSLVLFGLALLSKTVTATFPAAVLVIAWWKRGSITRRDVLAMLPFFALGIVAGLHTGYLERHQVGALGADWDLSPAGRILVAGRAVWFYLAKIIFPAGLSFIYPRWTIDPWAAWQWIYPAAVLAVLLGLWAARRRIGRGPLAGALLFAGTLAPALGFVNVFPMRYSFVADHFQYHASIAAIALLSAGLVMAARALAARRPGIGRRPAALAAGGAMVVLILGAAAMCRASVYRSLAGLWKDAREKNPGGWMVYTQLGHIAILQRPPDLDAARRWYFKALELRENDETQLDAGTILFRLGDLEGARRHLERSIALQPRKPGVHHTLGLVLVGLARRDEAIERFREALRLAPEFYPAHEDLGIALEKKGDLDGAIEQFRAAASLRPGDIAPLERLANALRLAKRREECEAVLRRVLELAPDRAEAHFDLALLLIEMKRVDEARPHLARAFQLNPALQQRVPGMRGK